MGSGESRWGEVGDQFLQKCEHRGGPQPLAPRPSPRPPAAAAASRHGRHQTGDLRRQRGVPLADARRNTQRVRRGRCGGRCTPLRTHCDPLRTTSEPPLPAAFGDGLDVQSPSFLAGCARTRSHRPTKAKTEHLNALMMHRRNGRSRRVSAPGPPRGAAGGCARTAPPRAGLRTHRPPPARPAAGGAALGAAGGAAPRLSGSARPSRLPAAPSQWPHEH